MTFDLAGVVRNITLGDLSFKSAVGSARLGTRRHQLTSALHAKIMRFGTLAVE